MATASSPILKPYPAWRRIGYWITFTVLLLSLLGQGALIQEDKEKCVAARGAVNAAYCDAWAHNQHQFGLTSVLVIGIVFYGIGSWFYRRNRPRSESLVYNPNDAATWNPPPPGSEA